MRCTRSRTCASSACKQATDYVLLFTQKNHAQGVIPPQAWIKETETELLDSKVLMLPGGFEPATPRNLALPRATRLSGQLPNSVLHNNTTIVHADLFLTPPSPPPAVMPGECRETQRACRRETRETQRACRREMRETQRACRRACRETQRACHAHKKFATWLQF